MKHNPLKLLSLMALVMAGIHGVTGAAVPAPVVPDLTKGAKNEGFQEWNMGPTGIRGGAFCQGFDTSASRQILVSEVAKGSPADGVLTSGDVILGVNGNLFDHDARRSLGEAHCPVNPALFFRDLEERAWGTLPFFRNGKRRD